MRYPSADKKPVEEAREEATPGAGGALERARCALRYDEFIWKVQSEAGLLTPAAASLAARATLGTLAERLRAETEDPDERRTTEELIYSLLEALPGRLSSGSNELSGYGQTGERDESAAVRGGAEFSMAEFFRRVGQRTGVGLAEAERHARAVAVTLDAAVPGRELDRARSRLPDEFELLFA